LLRVHWPGSVLNTMGAGQVITGASVSLMVKVKEHAFVFPAASVATHVTMVTPLLKVDPLAGVQTFVAPQLSVTVGLKTTLLLVH